MFNVSWEDPESETVAQRRERKERVERNSVQSSAASSLRSVESSDSSRTRSTHLAAKSTKASASKNATTPKRGISLLKNAKLPPTRKKLSLDGTGTSPDSQQTIKGVNREFPDEFGKHFRDSVAETLQSAPLSNGTALKFKFCMRRTSAELNASVYVGRSTATGSSWSSMTDNTSKSYEIQALAENSFITRSTEVTTTPQDCTDILTTPMSRVSISAEAPFSDEFTIEMDSDRSVFPH
jgi:hypothetical protein